MEGRVKIFGNLDELDKEKQKKLTPFLSLNKLIEKDPKITVCDVEESYLRIISENDYEKNKFSYSELDYSVKLVIEDSNLAINSILKFLEIKYPKKIVLLKEVLEEFLYFDKNLIEYIINNIINNKIGTIKINSINKKVEIYFDFKNFDFMEELKRLKNRLNLEFNK